MVFSIYVGVWCLCLNSAFCYVWCFRFWILRILGGWLVWVLGLFSFLLLDFSILGVCGLRFLVSSFTLNGFWCYMVVLFLVLFLGFCFSVVFFEVFVGL